MHPSSTSKNLLFSVVSVVSVFLLLESHAVAQSEGYPAVTPGKAIEFPRDAGAHPDYRIEWWYVTGHLDTRKGPLGFQVTFFRLRNRDAESNPSRFSPRQLLFAHAALADPSKGRLLQDQRSARAMADLVEAKVEDTGVRIDDWLLKREGTGYRAAIVSDAFALDLALSPTQPVLPQGDGGYSRKGSGANQASYYYTEPQLRVNGSVRSGSERLEASGVAWLDHEWSSEPLASEAVGWDWAGLNLDDGSALMAFRIRAKDGTPLWAGATFRKPGASPRTFAAGDVRFTILRNWKSPRTEATYPVAMQIEVAGERWRLEPLLDDQELDARASMGTVYWEGAVRVEGARMRGHGYLELTGYAGRLRF